MARLPLRVYNQIVYISKDECAAMSLFLFYETDYKTNARVFGHWLNFILLRVQVWAAPVHRVVCTVTVKKKLNTYQLSESWAPSSTHGCAGLLFPRSAWRLLSLSINKQTKSERVRLILLLLHNTAHRLGSNLYGSVRGGFRISSLRGDMRGHSVFFFDFHPLTRADTPDLNLNFFNYI